MTTFNNQDLQSKFDENGYIAINPLFSIDKIEEIKIELSRYINSDLNKPIEFKNG